MKCQLCGRPALVFVSDTDISHRSGMYCGEHAALSGITEDLVERIPISELVQTARSLNRLPIEQPTLPSGAVNPVYGRKDLEKFSVSEFIEILVSNEETESH